MSEKNDTAEKSTTGRRPSMYVPPDLFEEMVEQAEKYGISVSKCVQDAWKIARIYDGPSPNGVALFRDGPIDSMPEEEDEDEDA